MKRIVVAIAVVIVSGASAAAGTYRCNFLKDLAGVHTCDIAPGLPCDYSFSENLHVSCFATDFEEPILDQLNCVFRTPATNLEELIKEAEGKPVEEFAKVLAQKPGYVSGAGTWTAPKVGALTVGYIEKTGAPTLMAACTLQSE